MGFDEQIESLFSIGQNTRLENTEFKNSPILSVKPYRHYQHLHYQFKRNCEPVKPYSISREQKIRIRNTMLAALGGVLLSLVLIYAAYHQLLLISETLLFILLSIFWVVNLSVILTIYSGLNSRLRDPSLSLPQMYWAASCAAIAMMLTTDLDAPYYLLILLPMVFGVFRASVVQFQVFTLYVVVLTLITIALRYLHSVDDHLFSDELISWAAFIFCALTLASICKSIVILRLRLREKNAQLENILQARTYFLTNISHELRTPMNGVIGMLEVAMLKKMNDDLRSDITTARSSGVALLSVIDNILDFSKMEAGKIVLKTHQFKLKDVLDETLASFSAASRHKNLHMELHLNEQVPSLVRCDSSRLRQILNNLLGNAIKFTRRGGISIYISARPNVNPEQPSEVELRFTIKDSGIGIAAERVPHLFEIFIQADASTPHKNATTGLGLPIAKQLCEMMGGEIRVESKLNEGSTFFFNVKVFSAD